MPLTKLTIAGFQAHENRTIKLGPKITSIIGPTDVGKSSVIRALRWLCFNRPQGEAFIRDGCKQAIATLEIDGHTIERRKGDGANSYKLDGKTFSAFGAAVPDAITNFLNLDPINFQSQHDAPFWIGLSPGEVSRELNRIVNLDLIDLALGNIATEVRKAKSDFESSRERLEDAKKRKEQLAWVEQAHVDLENVDNLGKEAEEAKQKASRLARLAADRARLIADRDSLSGLILDGTTLLQINEVANKVREKADRLTDLVESGDRLTRDIREANQEKAEVEQLLQFEFKGKCPVCGSRLLGVKERGE